MASVEHPQMVTSESASKEFAHIFSPVAAEDGPCSDEVLYLGFSAKIERRGNIPAESLLNGFLSSFVQSRGRELQNDLLRLESAAQILDFFRNVSFQEIRTRQISAFFVAFDKGVSRRVPSVVKCQYFHVAVSPIILIA